MRYVVIMIIMMMRWEGCNDRIRRRFGCVYNRCVDRICEDLKWRNDDDEDKEFLEKVKLFLDVEGSFFFFNILLKFIWYADVGIMNRD